jgi:hypothetical protein
MAEGRHVVVTGTGISGRIPISHPAHPEGFVDVTPDSLEVADDGHAKAVCDAIEAEHYVRGTHPLQLAELAEAEARAVAAAVLAEGGA